MDCSRATVAVERSLPLGKPQPLYCGATGKLFLATMSDDEVTRYLAITPLVQLGPNTPTDAGRLMGEIARIRERGYAHSVNETGIGGTGLAAPIRDAGGQCVATLGLFAPSSRLPQERLKTLLPALCDGSKEISDRLGIPDAPAVASSLSRRSQ